MISIEFGMPIILYEQIPEAAEKTGESVEDLKAILNARKCVVTENAGDSFAGDIIDYLKTDENNVVSSAFEFRSLRHLTGSEGVIWLCKRAGYDIPAVERISISANDFMKIYNHGDSVWADICHLVSRVEFRKNRLDRLSSLSAPIPEIIQSLENRMFRECVETAQNNFGKLESEEKKPCKSFADVGYSLISGWPESEEEEV